MDLSYISKVIAAATALQSSDHYLGACQPACPYVQVQGCCNCLYLPIHPPLLPGGCHLAGSHTLGSLLHPVMPCFTYVFSKLLF